MARAAAAQSRSLLEFAKQFDPMRTTRMSVAATLGKLGWSHHSNEMISDGLSVDFTMEETFCAYEVVKADAYVDPAHADASRVPAVAADGGVIYDSSGRAMLPLTSPFPAAPPLHAHPLLGKVLDRATAARHELIRSKGWKLVVIPQPLWALACRSPHQHYARRDLLMSLTLPLAPFEPRPTATQNVLKSSAKTLEASTQKELATAAARMAARARMRKAEKAAADAQEVAARRAAAAAKKAGGGDAAVAAAE